MSFIRPRPLFAIAAALVLGLPPAYGEQPLDKAAAQLFIFGLPWSNAKGTGLTPSSRRHFASLGAGSFILFRRDLPNNDQARAITGDLHALAMKATGKPALITVDQEGGVVARIPFSPPLPSARALGATNNPVLLRQLGGETARLLRQYGINGNLAPVLDLGARDQSFIGSRAYGFDADKVSQMGNAFAQGLADGKVLPVAKHFPGLGPIQHDPHLMLVRRSTPSTELLSQDVLPFRRFASIFPSGLMVSHLVYPSLDGRALPGTFSREIQQRFARDFIGYQGLLMTDDLLMIKTKSIKAFQKNVQDAFRAGSDLIMISWSSEKQKAAVEAILDGVRQGQFTEAEVRSRSARVLETRSFLGRPDFEAPRNNQKLLLARSQKYEQMIDLAFQQAFEKQLVAISNRSPLSLIRPPHSIAKWLKGKIHRAEECAPRRTCFYFVDSKQSQQRTRQDLQRLKPDSLKDAVVIYLREVPIIAGPQRAIHLQIRTEKWAKHIAAALSQKVSQDLAAGDKIRTPASTN